MSVKRVIWIGVAGLLAIVASGLPAMGAGAVPGQPERSPHVPTPSSPTESSGIESDGQTVEDLSVATPLQLATQLAGPGVTVTSATVTGEPTAAGRYSGFADMGGSGIILSSGDVATAVGPNVSDSTTGGSGTDGDAYLDSLVTPLTTLDAVVMEVGFVPTSDRVAFDYVFASEEYNEFVGSSFNDVFAFQVNGHNCATVAGDPVTINTVNNGSHPERFRDNTAGGLDVEFDGLTTVLACRANVNPNVANTLRLALADTSDSSYDSAVFLRAGSLVDDQTGELTVVTDGQPNSAQVFSYSTTGDGLSAFSLDDDGGVDATLRSSRSFDGLAAGTYTVTQQAVPGWGLSGLSCNTGESVNLATRTVTVTLDVAEQTTCTFTSGSGSITVVENAEPDHPQDFGFTTTGSGLSPFSLDDDADPTLTNTRAFAPVAPGTYTVTQQGTAGWGLATLTCDTAESVNLATRTATITVGPAEDVSCTFANVALPRPDALVATAAAGPWGGNNLYVANPTAAQTRTSTITPGATRNLYTQVQNDGVIAADIRVRAVETGSNRYSATYFRGVANITTAVRSAGGYVVSDLAAGATVTIKVRMVAAANALRGTNKTSVLTVSAATSPTIKDIARLRVNRP